MLSLKWIHIILCGIQVAFSIKNNEQDDYPGVSRTLYVFKIVCKMMRKPFLSWLSLAVCNVLTVAQRLVSEGHG